MFCGLSGVVPEEPVITKSGHLYERRVVEKYIQDKGEDPVTKEPLSAADLTAIRTNRAVKPRPAAATSIPGMLALFQNEWDALMLETHTLRTSLGEARQELSYLLYQNDAACRVVARLTRERDAAVDALGRAERVTPADGTAGGGEKRPADADVADGEAAAVGGGKRAKGGLTPDLIARFTDVSSSLSKLRKKRAVPATLTSVEAVATFAVSSSHPLLPTTGGGMTTVALWDGPSSPSLVAAGGADGSLIVMDRAAHKVVGTLVGHTKRITSAAFTPSGVLLTSSVDKTVRVWSHASAQGPYACAAVVAEHSAAVTAVAIHATGDHYATASLDGTWAIHDISQPGEGCLVRVTDPGAGFTAAAFHPDGLILGTATSGGEVRIWDVKSSARLAAFGEHGASGGGAVTSLSFSENGYYLASCAGDGVRVWDLRKLKNFRTLGPAETGGPVASLDFDHAGVYLATGGAGGARVYAVKSEWSQLVSIAGLPAKGASAVRWGPDAAFLAIGASDHNLRIASARAAV